MPWWMRLFTSRLLLAPDSGDGGGGGGGSGEGDGGDGGDGAGEGDGGDGGEKDVDYWKSRSRSNEREKNKAAKRATELEERLAKLEGDSKSDHEKALEKARTEATAEARKEATTAVNRRLVAAEVKAAAGTKLADPADAVRLIDLDEFEVDDDGEIDGKAVAQAIDKLLKDKPYLAAKGKKPEGDADGGARGNEKDDKEVGMGMGRLRQAYASSSKK